MLSRIKSDIKRRKYWYKLIRPRERWATSDLALKSPNITAKLSEEELRDIFDLWGDYAKKSNRVKWFSLYKSFWPGAVLKYFIPDDFYYMYFDEFFAKRKECKIVDDKNIYSLLFYDIAQPRTIARIINGSFLSKDYQPITKDEFISLCKSEGRVIAKQSVDSEGGKGVFFYNRDLDDDETLKGFLKRKNIVVQEVIHQHPEMAKLHPESVNTVRIMTFFFENEVHVLSSVVRMGVGASQVDNASSGGIVCGINDDGTLKNRAVDVKANKYMVHPSGVGFNCFRIPGFEQCVEICRGSALRLVKFSRLMSWDFAIDEQGSPLLIEVNLSYGQVDFHQMCNGPIFGPLSERVIGYVFNNNTLIGVHENHWLPHLSQGK